MYDTNQRNYLITIYLYVIFGDSSVKVGIYKKWHTRHYYRPYRPGLQPKGLFFSGITRKAQPLHAYLIPSPTNFLFLKSLNKSFIVNHAIAIQVVLVRFSDWGIWAQRGQNSTQARGTPIFLKWLGLLIQPSLPAQAISIAMCSIECKRNII